MPYRGRFTKRQQPFFIRGYERGDLPAVFRVVDA